MRPVHLVPAGVVLLAFGAVAAVAQLTAPAAPGPGQASGAPHQVAVTSAVRACPPVQGGGPGRIAFIAGSPAASPPRGAGGTGGPGGTGGSGGTGGAEGPGQAELAPLPLAGAALRALSPITQAELGALSMLTTPAAQSASKKAATIRGRKRRRSDCARLSRGSSSGGSREGTASTSGAC